MNNEEKSNKERINIFLQPEVIKTLKGIAEDKGITVSALIRMIVLDYLKK